ncbi:MAG: tetratricopeptide repeat protein [Candidatus Riflebacteria bacterium]|nr:tetratricopeptide repeat protein [Candidatus Riflebacteria bacterium]
MNNHKSHVIILILICFFLKSDVIFSQDLTQQLFDAGVKLFSNKDYSGAADYFGQICDMSPDHTQARSYLVQSLIAMKKYREALASINKFLQKSPGNSEFVAMKQRIDALLNPPKVTVEAPASKQEYVMRTHTLSLSPISSEKPDKRPEKRPAKPAEPVKSRNTALDQALEAIDSQRYQEAINILDSLISKDPKNAQAWHYRGMVERQMGNHTEALPYFEKEVVIAPNGFEGYFSLGDILLKLGRLEEAEKAFEKAVKIKQGLYAMINLAETKKLLGKKKDTIELYKQIIKLEPEHPDAKLNIADALIEDGKIQEALGHVNDILSQTPLNGMAHFLKGKILMKNEMYDEAINEIRSAIAAQPDNEVFGNFLAKVFMSSGKTPEALDAANKVLQINPDNEEARIMIAEVLIKTGDIANAEDHVARIESSGKSARAFLFRARIFRAKGERDSALEMYKNYVNVASDDVEGVFEYAALLEESEDKASAVDMYKAIVEKFPGTSYSAISEERISTLGPLLAPAAQATQQPAPGTPQGKVTY